MEGSVVTSATLLSCRLIFLSVFRTKGEQVPHAYYCSCQVWGKPMHGRRRGHRRHPAVLLIVFLPLSDLKTNTERSLGLPFWPVRSNAFPLCRPTLLLILFSYVKYENQFGKISNAALLHVVKTHTLPLNPSLPLYTPYILRDHEWSRRGNKK